MKTKCSGIIAMVMSPLLLLSQEKEFGDAPEGALAYPSTGVIGHFPTCINVPLAGWIQHYDPSAYFLAADLETEGNQGLCPLFGPYDNDECFADQDAGLTIPETFTILNGKIVACPNSNGTSLGTTCQYIIWGQGIDIMTANFIPNGVPAFVNVLFDWDQNGSWGGYQICPQDTAPEHVLKNFPVPNGFSGLLSLLNPPPFLSGINPGFYWARFTISEIPVMEGWTGEGEFNFGETEDYLVYVGEFDFGDAPEGAPAYPPATTVGQFPTCLNVGTPNSFVKHFLGNSFFGPTNDGEFDGNAGYCPVFTPNTYDKDECFLDNDAGLIMPRPFTITGTVGNEQITPCSSSGTPLGTVCNWLNWGTDIDIHVNGQGYVNLLIDWNQDGKWAYDATTKCGATIIPEHVLVDFPVLGSINAPLSTLFPPAFMAGPNPGFVWVRFTISDHPVGMNWDGSGSFLDGETEDYLLVLHDSLVGTNPLLGNGGMHLDISPNPVTAESHISFPLSERGFVRLEMADLNGNIIAVLLNHQEERGLLSLRVLDYLPNWNSIHTGIYVLRLSINGQPSSIAKMVVIR